MPTRIPASERTSQKLDELLTQGVADGDALSLAKTSSDSLRSTEISRVKCSPASA